MANLNALDAYFNLNDVNAKFLDRSANLNDRNTNLYYTNFMAQIYFANLNDSFIKWNDKPILIQSHGYAAILNVKMAAINYYIFSYVSLLATTIKD